jgi:3-hexulose-6-phosphate synthase
MAKLELFKKAKAKVKTVAPKAIKTPAKLQLAVDSIEFKDAVALVEAAAPHVDIIEIGTPCIKYNGISLVRHLKHAFPKHTLLVDLKTMDAGAYEAEPFYAAGADICTVCGAAGIPTIAGFAMIAEKYGKKAQVDMINVADKVECARESVKVGAHIIGVHTGLDAQAAGGSPFKDLDKIAKLGLKAEISCAGGVNLRTAKRVSDAGADIVVCGAAIYAADSPADAAAEIKACVNT